MIQIMLTLQIDLSYLEGGTGTQIQGQASGIGIIGNFKTALMPTIITDLVLSS